MVGIFCDMVPDLQFIHIFLLCFVVFLPLVNLLGFFVACSFEGIFDYEF